MNIRYPVGHYSGFGKLKIAINFPEQLFRDIIKMAKKENKTFNDMVVELCKVGKLDLEESDKHEVVE
jgi:hypothetical protein